MLAKLHVPLLTVCLLALGPAHAAPNQWPDIRPGLWNLTGTRTDENGRVEPLSGHSRRCEDARWLFQKYWGRGKLDKAGCRYVSRKVSEEVFSIDTECTVRRLGRSSASTTVKTLGNGAFELLGELREGKRKYRIVQTGKWVSSCRSGG